MSILLIALVLASGLMYAHSTRMQNQRDKFYDLAKSANSQMYDEKEKLNALQIKYRSLLEAYAHSEASKRGKIGTPEYQRAKDRVFSQYLS